MTRGDIWRVRLPLTPGHTQGGERPAIIVQDDTRYASLPTVLVVPFTSALAAQRFQGTLLIAPDVRNGLSVPSVALVFQLTAVDRRNCLHRLGELDSKALDQIFTALDRLTGR
jgi:mRNA interferase MazF